LEAHTAELRLTIDSLERERDFYFNKLREIEIIAQNRDAAIEAGTQLSADALALLNELKKILYSTEVRPSLEGEVEEAWGPTDDADRSPRELGVVLDALQEGFELPAGDEGALPLGDEGALPLGDESLPLSDAELALGDSIAMEQPPEDTLQDEY